MKISDYRQLRQTADQRLTRAQNAPRIVLIYTALTIAMAFVVYVVNTIASSYMAQAGGLRNLELRSMLAGIQNVLPIAQALITVCLDVGYLAAMLRVARGQYVSANTLRLGFDRFWVLLRLTAIRGLLCVGAAIACSYAALFVYLLSPFSRPLMEIIEPILKDTTILSTGLVLSDPMIDQITSALTPMFILCVLVYGAVIIPILYRYRMASYVIVDKPALGALAAMKESRMMLRRNCFQLFLLDLKQWPYYLALAGASVVGYADVILSLLGVELPMSSEAAALVFFLAYLALLGYVYCTMRNRLETVYALAYETLRPKEESKGAVLGNIFQM